jgi:hypothetical protein
MDIELFERTDEAQRVYDETAAFIEEQVSLALLGAEGAATLASPSYAAALAHSDVVVHRDVLAAVTASHFS